MAVLAMFKTGISGPTFNRVIEMEVLSPRAPDEHDRWWVVADG